VDDVLSLLDKMTMAASIEGRVPMLDHRFVEFCYMIPEKVKFRNRELKGLIKSALSDILPDKILHLQKSGFAGPTIYWINRYLKESMYKHLIENPLPFYSEHLNIDVIKDVLDCRERYWRYLQTIFSLYIFSLWYKRHILRMEIII
jgi:asparagine synthase (glutamine-hydrolysing)